MKKISKKKKIIIGILAVLIIITSVIIVDMIKLKNESIENICVDITHRGKHPVNPCCPKCGQNDGIIQHKCSNPNGIDKYCRVCGKVVI